jgi:hypothetical protein
MFVSLIDHIFLPMFKKFVKNNQSLSENEHKSVSDCWVFEFKSSILKLYHHWNEIEQNDLPPFSLILKISINNWFKFIE